MNFEHGAARATSGLFRNLDEDGLFRLLQTARIETFSPKSVIVRQNQALDSIFIVIEGALRSFRKDEAGNETTIGIFKPGDVCMEEAYVGGMRAPVTLQALEQSRLLVLTPEEIIRARRTFSGLAAKLIASMSRRYGFALQRLEGLHVKTAEQRLGHFFLHAYLESKRNDLKLTVPFKKKDIAGALGMTPETLSRALCKLGKRGLEMDGDTFLIKDFCALCRFCDSDTQMICDKYATAVCRYKQDNPPVA